LQPTGTPYAAKRYVTAASSAIAILREAGVLATVYFLTAQLGLLLLAQPSDVAVFWPASGIAAGFLIVSGRRAYSALVVGVVIGTATANLLGDRNLITSILNGFCNAGEALLVVWLLDRWFGPAFGFGDLRRVLGFFAAAGLAAAASALGGAATLTIFHTSAPFWEVWRTWFLSDGVGIVVVTPFVVGLVQLWRELPRLGELIEGATALGLLVATSVYILSHPTTSWVSFSPGALVLPILLWLAARCHPTLTIAGAFVVSSAAICATIFGLGRFGDAAIPVLERVAGAQVAATMVTVYTLVLGALFSERRQREMELTTALNGAKLAEDQQRILVSELDHRVKNVLATVSAVAAQTLDASPSMEHFVAALDGRIRSMAATHEILSERHWQGIPLAELIRRELSPYANGSNTKFDGPEVMLTADAGQAMAMVFHELVTNAAKHGALSARKGSVSVGWHWLPNGKAHDRLVIEWQETGGPVVEAPSKFGYGTSVIGELVPHELGGTVDFALTTNGARCKFEIPAEWLNSSVHD
jgi:two-component sensor histidine kinase